MVTARELQRLAVVERATAGLITNAEGAVALRLSRRQFIRLRRRVATQGAAGIVHQGRGRSSHRRLAAALRAQITTLVTGRYAAANHTHAAALLAEQEGIAVSKETVRRLRAAAGMVAPRTRRPPRHRSRRERRAQMGAMVLLDGSAHRWLGPDGPEWTLQAAIDDATSAVVAAHFRPTEDLHGYFVVLGALAQTHGLPTSFYSDRHAIFRPTATDKLSLAEELAGRPDPTHFGRAAAELGIVQIFSRSPQARGRVERLWGTLQDRLVVELALAGVADLAEANAFLPGFLARHNAAFAVPPADPLGAWRPAPPDLDWFACTKYPRTVAHDNTVRVQERLVQIPRGTQRVSYAKATVEVHELLDGRLRVVYQGQVIATAAAPADWPGLRPRNTRRIVELGQLPVALIQHRVVMLHEAVATAAG